jgi:hypothetical protein
MRQIILNGSLWIVLCAFMLVSVPLSSAEHLSPGKPNDLEDMVSPNQITDVTDARASSRSSYKFVTVQGNCIKIGVKSTGSFGRGNTTPGIQYNKDCRGVFSNNLDFVTPDMPHEVVSVKLDGLIFADSNASCAYRPPSGGRCGSRFMNNLVNTSSISNESGKVYRGTRWNHRIVTKGTKVGYYDIENDIRFNRSDKIIEITTYLTPKRNYRVGLISRSVDSDAKIVTGDTNSTYNKLGYSVVGSKYLVFSETWISKAVMGMYTGEELNTGAGISSSWSQDPDTYLARTNDLNGDWTIGLAKKITNLVAGRTYTFRYSYVFGESAYKAVSNAINTGAAGGTRGKVPGCVGSCKVVDVGHIGPTVTPTKSPTLTPSPTTSPPYDSGDVQLCNSNCNFSSGMSGWSQSGGTFDVNSNFVRSSPYAVNGTRAETAQFFRSFSVSSYATYIDQSGGQVTVNAYIDPGNSENGAINVYFLSASGTAISGGWESGWKSNSREEWTQVSQSLNVPVGTRSIKIEFKARRTSGDYTDMNVDDVSVIARFRSTRSAPIVKMIPTVKP